MFPLRFKLSKMISNMPVAQFGANRNFDDNDVMADIYNGNQSWIWLNLTRRTRFRCRNQRNQRKNIDSDTFKISKFAVFTDFDKSYFSNEKFKRSATRRYQRKLCLDEFPTFARTSNSFISSRINSEIAPYAPKWPKWTLPGVKDQLFQNDVKSMSDDRGGPPECKTV